MYVDRKKVYNNRRFDQYGSLKNIINVLVKKDLGDSRPRVSEPLKKKSWAFGISREKNIMESASLIMLFWHKSAAIIVLL